MSYNKTNWQNLPNTSTPVNDANLNKMENGIADANGAISVNTYSNTSTYAIGDYCMYNNKLYRCKTTISTAENFNNTKWQEIKIMEEIANTGVTVSSTEPTGNNKNKVWFKKGKNLFNENSVTKGYAINSDGNGDSSSVTNTSGFIKVRAGKYTLSYDYSSLANQTSRGYCYFDNNLNYIAGNVYNPSNRTTTFTIANDGYIRFSFDKNCTNIQLEQGQTATNYEAPIEQKIYTKNNNGFYEEFNQDEVTISSVEPSGKNNKVWFKKGKNLFDAYEYAYYTRSVNETFQIKNANSIAVSGNNQTWSRVQITISNLKPNTQYTISSTVKNTSQHNAAIIVTIGGGESQNTSAVDGATLNVGFTTDATGGIEVSLFSNWSSSSLSETITYNNLQIEQGSSRTSFEPYVEPTIYTKNSSNIYEEFREKNEEINTSKETLIGKWLEGKNLYRRVVGLGVMPNATAKNVAHGLKNVNIIRCYGTAYNSSAVLPLPYVGYGGTTSSQISIDVVGTDIRVYTSSDRTSFNGYAILEYTKTTN